MLLLVIQLSPYSTYLFILVYQFKQSLPIKYKIIFFYKSNNNILVYYLKIFDFKINHRYGYNKIQILNIVFTISKLICNLLQRKYPAINLKRKEHQLQAKSIARAIIPVPQKKQEVRKVQSPILNINNGTELLRIIHGICLESASVIRFVRYQMRDSITVILYLDGIQIWHKSFKDYTSKIIFINLHFYMF